MRLFLIAALLLASLAPTAAAHQCASGTRSSDCTCPVPSDGQYHQHSSPGGSCQGGPGGAQSATPGGASQSIPAPSVGLALALVAGLVLLTRGRGAA